MNVFIASQNLLHTLMFNNCIMKAPHSCFKREFFIFSVQLKRKKNEYMDFHYFFCKSAIFDTNALTP